MASVICVVGFDRLQHYKDRNPPWIKLYGDLLDNYDFCCLQDASKWLALGLMILASKNGNRIPADPRWIASKLSCTVAKIDLQPLVIAGLITMEQDASEVLEQDASKVLDLARSREERQRREETEGETEQKKKARARRGGPEWFVCPDDWTGPKERHQTRAAALNLDLERQARKFRAHEFKESHVDADRTFDKWLENAAEWFAQNGGGNGNGRASGRQAGGDWRHRPAGTSVADGDPSIVGDDYGQE